MFKSYFSIAYRNLVKHKLYTAINVLGLAVGLALCLLIVSHISYELSFESNQENVDRIYRVNGSYVSAEDEIYSARVMAPIGNAIASELTEVEEAAIFRIRRINVLKIGNERFKVDDPSPNSLVTHHHNMIFANPGFLDVFTVPLLQGNPRTVLSEPFSMLITEKAALEYFGSPNPVGEVVKINDRFECHVAGILQEIPQNTQLYCDFLISYATLEALSQDVHSWDQFATDYVYLLLGDNVDPGAVEMKLPAVLKNHVDPVEADKYTFSLQRLDNIFFVALGSGRSGELSPVGEMEVIVIYGMTALFILLQAIANFINLSTARSADRIREVGVRKVFGAFRWDLIKQFLGESILIAVFAMLVSIPIYELLKAQVTPLMPREMLVNFYSSPMMLVSIILLIAVVGVVAGYYPALYLSRFKPVKILQGKSSIRSSRSWLRRILVVFQFSVAIIFIVCSVTIFRQLNYVTSYNLGFDHENMLVLDFRGENRTDDCQLMRNEIVKNKNVIAATMTDNPPGRGSGSYGLLYRTEERREDDRYWYKPIHGDYDFISTFDLDIIQGREFSREHPGDAENAVIVNEAVLAKFEIENPIGHKFYTRDGFLEIIGVVEDFYGTLIGSGSGSRSFIMLDPEKLETLVVKLSPENIPTAIKSIEQIWKATLPEQEFKYNFLDDEIAGNYGKYRDNGAIILALTLMSIAIACLGIFGLVSFTAEQRTKEIGIRKVLGSSVAAIIRLLSREFVILIAIANVIAWPLAYMLMSALLQDFVVRISLGLGTFLLAGLATIVIALATASYQSIKAAIADPVKSLRYE